jgi:hypothetical protein
MALEWAFVAQMLFRGQFGQGTVNALPDNTPVFQSLNSAEYTRRYLSASNLLRQAYCLRLVIKSGE